MRGSSFAPYIPVRLARTVARWNPGANAILLGAVVFFALIAAALLSSVRPTAPAGIPAIDRMEFQPAGTETMATGTMATGTMTDASAGKSVGLPHRCPPATGIAGCAGTYRATFLHDGSSQAAPEGQAPASPWSVYVPTYSGRAIVRINGEFLFDSRVLKNDSLLVHAGPLLTPIPAAMLHEGENRLEIEISSWSRVGGFLDTVFVGPDAALRTVHQSRYLFLEAFPRLLVAWQAALGLALLIVWIGHREQQIHLMTSLIMGLGWLQGIPLFVVDPDVSDWVLRCLNFAGIWQATCLPVVISQLFQRPLPVGWRWLLIPPSAVTIAFLLTSIDPVVWQPYFLPLWSAVGAPWVICVSIWSLWATLDPSFKKGDTAARIVFSAYLLALILVIHDILAFTGAMPSGFPLLSRFLPPLVTTAISGVLMWRFAMALGEVSRFNTVLRQEIEAAEVALRASFERERTQNRAAALDGERRRLTRDLHDGLAGQLVSIVAQCELPGRDFGKISKAARMALDDLRLVIASMDDVGDDLAMMLALFHERIGPQLQAQEVELNWRMVSLPAIEGLRSEHALALFRILQEAVTNAVRHSGCRSITIGMTPSQRPGYAVRISVADRGRGGIPKNPDSWRGLRNMRDRAAGMGAAFSVESTDQGTEIVLDLPRTLPGSAET